MFAQPMVTTLNPSYQRWKGTCKPEKFKTSALGQMPHLFFKNFYFGIMVDLQMSCKDSKMSLHMLFMEFWIPWRYQLPSIHMLKLRNQHWYVKLNSRFWEFNSFPISVLYSALQGQYGLHTVFIHHVFLVSSGLWQFLRLFLSAMTLIVLRSPSQAFCRMSLSLRLSGLFFFFFFMIKLELQVFLKECHGSKMSSTNKIMI
jgi:hypothetical protein